MKIIIPSLIESLTSYEHEYLKNNNHIMFARSIKERLNLSYTEAYELADVMFYAMSFMKISPFKEEIDNILRL